jgi:hypothetical protein
MEKVERRYRRRPLPAAADRFGTGVGPQIPLRPRCFMVRLTRSWISPTCWTIKL